MTCFGHNPYARDPLPSWRWLVLLLALVAGGVSLVSCRETPPPPPPPAAAPTPPPHDVLAPLTGDTTPKETDEVQRLRTSVAERARDLAAARADLAAAEEARDAARKDRLALIAWWVAGIALLGTFASVALWFLLPAGLKRWAIGGGGACVGVLLAAVTVSALLPYLAWIIGALVVAGLAWLLWFLARTIEAGRHAAAHGDRLEQAVRDWLGSTSDVDEVLAAVKQTSIENQTAAGLRPLIAALRGKPAPVGA